MNTSFSKEKCVALDYGCGSGEFIRYANNNGYRFRGVDNYYDTTNVAEFNESDVKNIIDIIKGDGVLPFNDKAFDFISSIQVFEDVENLEAVLKELERILKDNGKILCSLPLLNSFPEDHFGIPFSHWFSPSNKFRKLWVRIFYTLGFGFNKNENLAFDEWYKEAFHFIDNFCFYRTKKEFVASCKKIGFSVKDRGKEALIFRLKLKGGVWKLMTFIVTVTPDLLVSKFLQTRGSVTLELKKL